MRASLALIATVLVAATSAQSTPTATPTPSNTTNATHAYRGFNYGSTYNNNTAKYQADFQADFLRARYLADAPQNYTSARLYTMIQAGTQDTPISAIPAAIATNTSLLLGMWASAGQQNFDLELSALNKAIQQYGTNFTKLIAGISVGSEDLYRITPTGESNLSGAGAQPDELVSYIQQTRALLKTAGFTNLTIGHVDTWTAWVNNSNNAVIQNCDWIGMDTYPYFQFQEYNSIDNANDTFWTAYNVTVQAVQANGGNQSVWVTETSWPVSGPTSGNAVASVQNAQTYYQEVACSLFRANISTWWFTLIDADPYLPSPSFGLINNTTPGNSTIYNITCKA